MDIATLMAAPAEERRAYLDTEGDRVDQLVPGSKDFANIIAKGLAKAVGAGVISGVIGVVLCDFLTDAFLAVKDPDGVAAPAEADSITVDAEPTARSAG